MKVSISIYLFFAPTVFFRYIYIENPSISHLACIVPAIVHRIFFDARAFLKKSTKNFRSNTQGIL
jgi:hypothetical protein